MKVRFGKSVACKQGEYDESLAPYNLNGFILQRVATSNVPGLVATRRSNRLRGARRVHGWFVEYKGEEIDGILDTFAEVKANIEFTMEKSGLSEEIGE